MPRKKVLTSKQFANQATGVRLSSHEKLCAERKKLLLENIKEMRKEVNQLKETVSMGKGMVKLLVFLGTVVAGAIGYFSLK
jgi:hypothetical protein